MIWLPSTSVAETPPEEVVDSELLARSVHQKSGVKWGDETRGEEVKVTFRAFDPPKDREDRSRRSRDISVERSRYITEGEAVALACGRAPLRGGEFFGWAVISARCARGHGTQVLSSPPDDGSNPAHADMRLPAGDIFDDQDRNGRLTDLAAASKWYLAPSW